MAEASSESPRTTTSKRDAAATSKEKEREHRGKKRKEKDVLSVPKAGSSGAEKSRSSKPVDGDGWCGLPAKVLRMVFSYLSERDLCRLCSVAKAWTAAASDDALWKDLYHAHFPEDKQRKRLFAYKELFRSRVERARDPLSVRAPTLETTALATARGAGGARRRHTPHHSASSSTSSTSSSKPSRARKARAGETAALSGGGGSAVLLSDAFALWSRELLQWLAELVCEEPYALSHSACDSLAALGSGLALLALAHRADPTAIDYEGFDKKNADKALAAALQALEDALGVPALLDVRELQTNADPRATLLWLATLRAAWEDAERGGEGGAHAAALHAEVTHMSALLDEGFARVSALEDEFHEASLELGAVLATQDSAEEKVYLEARALLMERALSEALQTIAAADERHTLLQEENRLLQEKLALLERDLRIEETARRRVEEQLEVEERVRAAGEELSDRGALDYLKLFEKRDEPTAASERDKEATANSAGTAAAIEGAKQQ